MESAKFNGTLNITIRVKGNISPEQWNDDSMFGDWIRDRIQNKQVEYLDLDILTHKLTQIK
jgi:hypothetical protein